MWGNPYTVKDYGRDECIKMYREYIIQKLEKDPLLRKELASLRGQVLGCYCKPQACHGDVLVELMHSEEFNIY